MVMAWDGDGRRGPAETPEVPDPRPGDHAGLQRGDDVAGRARLGAPRRARLRRAGGRRRLRRRDRRGRAGPRRGGAAAPVQPRHRRCPAGGVPLRGGAGLRRGRPAGRGRPARPGADPGAARRAGGRRLRRGVPVRPAELLRGRSGTAGRDARPALRDAAPVGAHVHRHQLRVPCLRAPGARVLRAQLPVGVHGVGRGAARRQLRGLPHRGGPGAHVPARGRTPDHGAPRADLPLRPRAADAADPREPPARDVARRAAAGAEVGAARRGAASGQGLDGRGGAVIGAFGGLIAQAGLEGEGSLSTRAHVFVVVVTLLSIVFIVRLVRRHHLRSKYSLLWITVALVLATVAIFPGLLARVSRSVGVYYPPATFLILAVGFLFLIVV